MALNVKVLSIVATGLLALGTAGCQNRGGGSAHKGSAGGGDQSGSFGGGEQSGQSGSMGGGNQQAEKQPSGQSGAYGAGSQGSSGTQSAQQLQGTVTKTSPDQLTIRTQNGQTQQLKADQNTSVIIQGRPGGDISQIQEGSQVRASYSGQGSNMKATSIEVMGSGQGGATGGGSTGGGTTGGGTTGGGTTGGGTTGGGTTGGGTTGGGSGSSTGGAGGSGSTGGTGGGSF